MRNIYIVSLAVAAAMASTPSFADVVVQNPPRSEATQHKVVYYADLDLFTPQGVEHLNHRLDAAAHEVCDNPGTRDLGEQSAARTCRRQSLALAYADRDAVIAAQLAARSDPSRIAALGSGIAISRK